MTRFLNDQVYGDLPYTNGAVFHGPKSLLISTNLTGPTRDAAGDISMHQAASLTGTMILPLDKLMRKITALDTNLNNDGTTSPLGLAPVAKGINLTDITIHYLISVANLTSQNIRVDRCKYVNGVANAVTSILAAGTNGLATTFAATPYTTKIPITDAMDVTDNDCVVVELVVVTPASSTYQFSGITAHYSYNWN